MVAKITPHLKTLHCPAELRSRPMWLMWRYEDNGPKKPRKVPYYTHGGRRHGKQGTPEDRAQLVTFDAALQEAMKRGMDGVGFAVLEGSGLTVIDFDHCVGPGGLDPKVVELCAGTYAEFSPSGQGAHAVFEGDLGNRKDAQGEPFGLETFSSNGYVTFTGNALPGSQDLDLLGREVAPLPEHVRAYCEERFTLAGVSASRSKDPRDDQDPLDTYSPKLELSIDELRGHLQVLPKDLSYDDWLAVGMGIHHETDGSDEGFLLWDSWSSESPKYTTTEYSRERWDSFGQRGGRLVTVRSLLKLSKEYGGGVAPAAAFDAMAAAMEALDEALAAEGAQVVEGAPTPAPAPAPDGAPPPAPAPDGAPPPAPKREKFTPVAAAEFANGPDPEWLLHGVLPEGPATGVIYGESGSGKTFLMLDIAFAVARGLPWRGLDVKQGRVAYVAVEGQGGLRKRLRAYARHNGIDLEAIDLVVIPDSPNLLMPGDTVALAQRLGRARLVVIDTMAASMPGGNENAGEDVGKLLHHCLGIARGTKALVMLVHHSGKDQSRGSRGWSGIKGNVDVELEVSEQGATRVLSISKLRDGDDTAGPWAFRLERVLVGLDSKDQEVTSCVVMPADVPPRGGSGRGPAVRVRGKLEVLLDEVITELKGLVGPQLPAEEVLQAAIDRLDPPDGEGRDTRRQRVRRALETLCDDGSSPYWMADGTIEVRE